MEHSFPFVDACLHNDTVSQRFVERDLGRWSLKESQIYLTAISCNHTTRTIVQALLKVMPNRTESQIRAHHQKMIKKHKTTQRIFQIMTHHKNQPLLKINRKLEIILQRFENNLLNTNL